MAYNYGGYNPQYQQYPNWQSQPAVNDLVYRQAPLSFSYVLGIEGAKAFPLGPNQEVFLMDSQDPVAYIKSADAFGKQTLRVYDLIERTEETKTEPKPEIDTSQFVRRDEIGGIVSDAVDKAMSGFTVTPTKSRREERNHA